MLQTPLVSIVSVLAASVLGAAGQYLFKTGTDRATSRLLSFLLSPWILCGMICYIVVMILFTYAFRKGGTVVVLYPIYATTFIWAAVIAQVVYGTPIRPIHVLGMALLIVGMYCMGLGNARVP
jgi:multidrug transporter EmrE-like cation transporter